MNPLNAGVTVRAVIAWEYANEHGAKFLTHDDPVKWHPHDLAGFKDFQPLVYAAGVALPLEGGA